MLFRFDFHRTVERKNGLASHSGLCCTGKDHQSNASNIHGLLKACASANNLEHQGYRSSDILVIKLTDGVGVQMDIQHLSK